MTTAVFLAPTQIAGGPFFIPGGNQPANGGQLFTYITGTSTKLATYTTSSGSVAYSNPIVLDSGGFITGSGEIWLIQSSTYRFILAPSTDTDPPASPYWTRDSIVGMNDFSNASLTVATEWVPASTTPVFSNASTFVMSGDQTQLFTVGMRVKTTNSGGTVYGTITSTVFTTSTTITILRDANSLDAGLSAVSYSFMSSPHISMPYMLSDPTQPGGGIQFITSVSFQLSANVASTFTHAGTLLGFYGATATTQAATISSVNTTAPVSASPFGFTSTQASDIITRLNTVIADLKRFGLTT